MLTWTRYCGPVSRRSWTGRVRVSAWAPLPPRMGCQQACRNSIWARGRGRVTVTVMRERTTSQVEHDLGGMHGT